MNSEALIPLDDSDFSTTLVSTSIKGAMKAAGAGSRDLWQIDPFKLRVIEGFNPRVDTPKYLAHIRSLAESIKTEGFYQDEPLAGYAAMVDGEQVVFIYAGHSRLRGVKLAIQALGAEVPRVPVSVSTDGLSMEDMTVALIRGNDGKSLTYYESAIVCKRLVKYGFEIDEISRRTGITVPLVKARLVLMAAPLKLRELVANEVVSATLALEMITTHGDKALEKLEAAMGHAGDSGKTRVTKTQTAKADVFDRARFVKKAAPKLYEAASLVREDPGYSALSAETRELIEDLLTEIRGTGDKDSEGGAATDPRQLPLGEIASS